MCDVSSLPTEHSKILLYELLIENNVKNVKCSVTAGSEKGDNYVGDIKRIKVMAKSDGRVFFNLIMKYTPRTSRDMFDKMSIAVENMYDRESIMYRLVLPTFVRLQEQFNVPKDEMFTYPKCYKADNQMLLLEDLNVYGFKMRDRFVPYDLHHMELVLKNLGRYHALSFALKEHDPDTYWDFVNFVRVNIVGSGMVQFISKITNQALTVIDECHKDNFRAFFEKTEENYIKFTSSATADPYNVICHGDTWNNNILYKYENGVPVDMRFLDWQISRYYSPVIDIANSLYCSTESKLRTEHGSRLFDFYYNSLDGHLRYFKLSAEKCYPRHIFDEHLKMLLPYGLLLGASAIPVMLSEKGKESGIEDWLEPEDDEPISFGKANTERLNDLVKDFIEMKYI